LVFKRLGKIVFVHGCFWHRHQKRGCPYARLPKSKADFWTRKLEANRLRDARQMRSLRAAGWKVLVVWECELRHIEQLENRLRRFLEDENASNRAIRGRGRTRNRR
jgi:DNA mismatch endonuclease (patch repair protein)